jgi:predicted PolB exonuclease-like 3'-5' exonuclease
MKTLYSVTSEQEHQIRNFFNFYTYKTDTLMTFNWYSINYPVLFLKIWYKLHEFDNGDYHCNSEGELNFGQ